MDKREEYPPVLAIIKKSQNQNINMKKGQNNAYEHHYFQTGISHKKSYSDLLADIKNRTVNHQQCKNIKRNKKNRK